MKQEETRKKRGGLRLRSGGEMREEEERIEDEGDTQKTELEEKQRE